MAVSISLYLQRGKQDVMKKEVEKIRKMRRGKLCKTPSIKTYSIIYGMLRPRGDIKICPLKKTSMYIFFNIEEMAASIKALTYQKLSERTKIEK